MKKLVITLLHKINTMICRIDEVPLWWIVFLLFIIVMSPHMVLKEGSVFTVHDQLDESMMNYVLTAKNTGGIIPEMLGGINASGLTPSAVLFVPLFWILPPFYAFLCMYGMLVLGGFLGMYFLVRELTESSILAVISAGIFCMLPLYPIYGFSQMGLPFILYAFICLWKEKHVFVSLGLTILFGVTSHLVYSGYVVLFFWLSALFLAKIFRKGREGNFPKWCAVGFVLLVMVYTVTNLNLISEIVLGRTLSGQPCYVSHREEMIRGSLPFWKTVWTVFVESAQHAFTYHKYLILPIFILLILSGIFYKKLNRQAKERYYLALGGILVLFLIAVFYGICKSEPVTNWLNGITGFLHYFQMERFYWIYPAGWYLEFALAFSVWWSMGRQRRILQSLVLSVIFFPTADIVLHNSYFYMNVNQKNNGSDITGYISWESYYAEDLMEQIEEAISKDMSTYRVAHLGISPCPALMHGFYTVDGYSNNYSLDYKHRFRQVIAAELDKAPDTAVYFDKWGNRCYLFNSQTGNYWMLGKGNGIVYENLQFDMNALSELGCEYLFSGGEIKDPDKMGLKAMGYYETENSYWGIWVYELTVSQKKNNVAKN